MFLILFDQTPVQSTWRLNSGVEVINSTMPQKNNGGSDDVKLVLEEATQLEEAFEDDKSCKIMAEYVSELSDPKHKEEQEACIAQLETQNEVPSGKALVRPSRLIQVWYARIVLDLIDMMLRFFF